jgi:hypothetical protein
MVMRPIIVKVFYEQKAAIRNGDTEYGLTILEVTREQMNLLSDVGREWLASARDRHGRLIDRHREVLRVDSSGWIGVCEAIGRELDATPRDQPAEKTDADLSAEHPQLVSMVRTAGAFLGGASVAHLDDVGVIASYMDTACLAVTTAVGSWSFVLKKTRAVLAGLVVDERHSLSPEIVAKYDLAVRAAKSVDLPEIEMCVGPISRIGYGKTPPFTGTIISVECPAAVTRLIVLNLEKMSNPEPSK